MANPVKPRRSFTANRQPLANEIAENELVINWADGRAFTRDAGGNIIAWTLGGAQGATGPAGPAAALTIGTVTSGSTPSATITGTAPNQVLNLVLAPGAQGPQGPASVTIGTVTTLTAGSSATVTNGGDSTNVVLNFGLPRGQTGGVSLGLALALFG